MSGPELLELAAQAITTRSFCASGSYELCEVDGRISCEPRQKREKALRVFMKLTNKQCENGLTVKEWNRLEKQLLEHFKGDVKCLPLPKT